MDRVPRALLATLLVVLALAGCGVRAQTPPPPLPEPGPSEVARQETALAARRLAEGARLLADATVDERLYAVLEQLSLDAEAHLAALGGVHEDGPAEEDDEEAPPVPTPDELLAELTGSADAALRAAVSLEDGALAQLLVVVAGSRLLAAEDLARRAGLERPRPAVLDAPTVRPEGVPGSRLAAMALAEDQARFGLELLAARSEGDRRERAAREAARHERASQAWADLAGSDPRRIAYALEGADAPEADLRMLAARLESALVTGYAALVPEAAPGSRAELAALHLRAARAARGWGASLGPLPGLEVDLATQGASSTEG